MGSNIASSKVLGLGVTLALLMGTASGLRPLEQSLAEPVARRSEQLGVLAGQGTVVAVISGMRSVVASGYWLLANQAWERREAAALAAYLELTVAADERPLYFWLNGARMLAYDLPEWRMTVDAPLAWRQRIREEQAKVALEFLHKGCRWHGSDAALFLEMAGIHLRSTGDLAQAAHWFRTAAQQPGAPYHAARIHADLLQKMGRLEEARDWLREILPGLPANDASAHRTVVVERIQTLDRLLAAR